MPQIDTHLVLWFTERLKTVFEGPIPNRLVSVLSVSRCVIDVLFFFFEGVRLT